MTLALKELKALGGACGFVLAGPCEEMTESEIKWLERAHAKISVEMNRREAKKAAKVQE